MVVCIEWVDGKIEDAEMPEGLMREVLPAIYSHPTIWRVYYIGENVVYPTWKEYRAIHGGVITPQVDEIEERRAKEDIERFAKEIDAIGKGGGEKICQ